MLKLRAGNAILLGLSELNIQKLKEDKPILFEGSAVGLGDVKISIIYGVTEKAIVDRLIASGLKIEVDAEGRPVPIAYGQSVNIKNKA